MEEKMSLDVIQSKINDHEKRLDAHAKSIEDNGRCLERVGRDIVNQGNGMQELKTDVKTLKESVDTGFTNVYNRMDSDRTRADNKEENERRYKSKLTVAIISMAISFVAMVIAIIIK